MSEHLHKRFTTDQVKHFLKRYIDGELKSKYLLEIMGIKESQFFDLLSRYKKNPKDFSIEPKRSNEHRKIDPLIEQNILKELKIDKGFIHDKDVNLWKYNYSYVQMRLKHEYGQLVSVPTIIDRAKKHDYYLKRRKKRKTHDREVLTHHAGELIQHDSSHHKWAPSSERKWYLITSIDDYSRFMFYAHLVERDTVWRHIGVLQDIVLKWGLPFQFYVDCHSIFRFVRGRDEFHYKHHAMTDDIDPQWKQVMKDCGIKALYALSPEAKGKIERPYGWIQDHLVRTCGRNNVKDIGEANRILGWEMHQYNYKKRHSMTDEVPYYRLKKAIENKKSLFREFKLKPPYISIKDIFALRADRVTNQYCKVSINNCEFKVPKSHPRQFIDMRIYPLTQAMSEVRFWRKGEFLGYQRAKNSDLQVVRF